MRALVVYESIFGNTRDVATSIAAGLRTRGDFVVDLVEVGEAPASGEGYDLLVVGGPIHAWGMTRPGTRSGAREQAKSAQKEPVSTGIGVREWLRMLAPTLEEHPAAAFDTAMKTRWFPVGSAAKGEAKALARSGYQLIVAPEHFRVEGTEGPMVPGELERAQAWGAMLAESIDEHRKA